jgi:hypothetical protein
MKTFLGLKKLHPELTTKDVSVVVHPDGTSSVEWHTSGYETPDDFIWEQASASAEIAFANRKQRAVSYPSIGDQLDALWKGGEAAAEMLVQIQAIKAKYPKPE